MTKPALFTVYLDPETRERLDHLAEHNGVTRSSIIRLLIRNTHPDTCLLLRKEPPNDPFSSKHLVNI